MTDRCKTLHQNPPILIRPATRDDEASICQLVEFVHREYQHPMYYNGRDQDLTDIESSHPWPQAGFWVIETETAELIGTGAFRPLAQGNPKEDAELRRIYLYPQYRGLKLGTKLIQFLAQHAKAAGYKRFVLESHTSMEPAVKFYQRNGFNEIPVYAGEPLEYSDIAFEYRF